MISSSIAFLIALAVTAFITPWIRRRALNWGAVDDPARARKVHTKTIPRLGGLAIAAGFFAALLALLAFETSAANIFAEDIKRVVGLFGGATLMLALGLYDDLLGADARKKLLVQAAAAALMCMLGFSFERISLPWGGEIDVGMFGYALTFLWIVGITNAINLIDGLDGLAAGVCLFAVVTMAVVSFVTGQVIAGLVAAALAGALVGFLFHNFHPATIFMGDTGSLFIGFVVAATGLMTNTKSSTAVALLIPVIALGLPIMDTMLAAARRVLQGRSPFSADQEHVHHRLLSKGLSHRSTVLALWGFCLVACAASAAMVLTKGTTPVYILGGFAFVALVAARSIGYLQIEEWPSLFVAGQATKRRLRIQRLEVRAIIHALTEAQTLDELFQAMKPQHGLHTYVAMRIEVSPGPAAAASGAQGATMVWERADAGEVLSSRDVTLDLTMKRGSGSLVYRYADGRPRLNVEEEELLEVVRVAVGQQLDRLFVRAPATAGATILPLRRKQDH